MNPPTQAAFNLPYSPVRQAGELYFISGHTGVDLATNTTQPDIGAQTQTVFKNLAATLETAGLELSDLIKTTVFLTDMADFPAFNDVYAGYFSDPKPARSTIAVRELPPLTDTPLKIEIEAVAFKKAVA